MSTTPTVRTAATPSGIRRARRRVSGRSRQASTPATTTRWITSAAASSMTRNASASRTRPTTSRIARGRTTTITRSAVTWGIVRCRGCTPRGRTAARGTPGSGAGRCSANPASTRGRVSRPRSGRRWAWSGLMPYKVFSLEQQAARSYGQYSAQPTALAKNVFLTALHDRNEVLFYRLLTDHLPGDAADRLHADDRGGHRALQPPVPPAPGRVPVGRRPGADRVVAGRHRARPPRRRPDRGHRRRGDPRHRRLGRRRHRHRRGQARRVLRRRRASTPTGPSPSSSTWAPTARNCSTTRSTSATPIPGSTARPTTASSTPTSPPPPSSSPTPCSTGRTSAPSNAHRILDRYRDRILTFNDDIQGTGAVNLAAVLSGVAVSGVPLADHRVVIFGAGSAGSGHRPTNARRHDRRRAERGRRRRPGSGPWTVRVC